jgi:5'-nucleotidase
MQRRQFLKTTLQTSIALCGTSMFTTANAKQHKKEQLHILHTNDVHSRLDPMPNDGSKYAGMGGVLNRKITIDAIKQKHSNVILLDSGDMFQGTPYFNLYKGEAEITAMNMLGYDAGTLGNHDFDGGIDNLAKQLQNAKFVIVNCNYELQNTVLNNIVKPYTIIKRNGLRIGVIGVGIELKGLVPDKLCPGVVYNNPVPIVNEIATKLKHKKKCDIVIVLSHLGYTYKDDNKLSDVSMAPQLSNVDAILGGHTHTFLDEPFLTYDKEKKPIQINQVGWGGIQLGHLEFDIIQANSNTTTLKAYNGIFVKKTSIK